MSADFIAIVDYGMGNVRSVANAFLALGRKTELTADPSRLAAASAIVLPGVGAFGDGMKNLRERGLVDVLGRLVLQEKKSFLGICLGMQLVAKRGFEGGEHEGLGWLDAEVVPLRPSDPRHRIPHMGWNDTNVVRGEGLFRELENPATFYYLHSFHLRPPERSSDWVSGTCSHGEEFVAAFEAGNLRGVQFHPEKSQGGGLTLLANFLRLSDAARVAKEGVAA